MSENPRLDLSTAQAKANAQRALPALMFGSAVGDPAASAMAGQIIGQAFADALRPSFDALARLRVQTTNHEIRRHDA